MALKLDGAYVHHDCHLRIVGQCRSACAFVLLRTSSLHFFDEGRHVLDIPLGAINILIIKLKLARAEGGSNLWTSRLHASSPSSAGVLAYKCYHLRRFFPPSDA